MKNTCYLLIGLLIFTSCKDMNSEAKEAVTKQTEEQLRHVVLFSFKETAKPAEVEKVEAAFANLAVEIDEIKAFEWGLNNSPENLNKGFTHCFFVTFTSEQDRDSYLVHPKHQEFGAMLGPVLEDVLVVDYWKE
ncbi:stress responsive alpha/beta barrel protein [Leeuwenhoekiella aestuarii]|uniref:Stress responsive alpha/beta barrel protein n=1 Tax=Leeuwenhoekiella aestuarii TaxID=2249426 RepID=A0A4Q0NT58_9FLAO|nr:Dabb family protein [Leeuwenhoekiella aestuarii]RXG14192.1 stress responsive alpha/beta barrel protein [Leeuwenhoekiella aestuarii]RXG18941.1 stress responsive alpha/beta barrel protein [Leeuwenhoekiella aestuarii]